MNYLVKLQRKVYAEIVVSAPNPARACNIAHGMATNALDVTSFKDEAITAIPCGLNNIEDIEEEVAQQMRVEDKAQDEAAAANELDSLNAAKKELKDLEGSY